MRVLAIGECMAELSPTTTPDEYRLGFAGDTFNTAWYLARLSADIGVSYFTAVGDDEISARMLHAIQESGIDTSHVRVAPDRSVGLYMISLENGERSFSYWRGQSAARLLARDVDALTKAVDGADLVYFSGITLAILDEPGRRALLEAVRSARQQGKRIAFDPNLRPHLWDNPAHMTEVVMQAATLCDIALPSFEDEARWFADADPEATLDRYTQAGTGTIIVKNGADRVWYRDTGRHGTVDVPALPSVVDTTSAGDSFNAAVLAGIASGAPLGASVARACRLAGQVVQGKGALVPVDLDRLDPLP